MTFPSFLSRGRFAGLFALALLLTLGACATEPDPTDSAGSTADDSAEGEVTEVAAVSVEPGTYAIDNAHSEAGFRIKHLGISNVDGTFNEVDGRVMLPSESLADMQATATIQAASIDTQNEDRDNHLRSGDFFDVEQYPTITFESTSVEPLGGSRFRMTGDLTMHGQTHPVTLEGEYGGSAVAPDGTRKIALSAEGQIDRTQWGLTWNRALETGGLVVGEDVTLMLGVEADQQEGSASSDSVATAAMTN